MKTAFLFLAVLGLSFSATASPEDPENDVIVSCFGDHHGSYLDFTYVSRQNGPTDLMIKVSTDAGEEVVIAPYKVSFFQRESLAVAEDMKVQTLLDIVRDMNDGAATHRGTAILRAENAEGSHMPLHLNKFDDTSYVVTDGYVEPLTCQISEE